jgi:hypothetical protein
MASNPSLCQISGRILTTVNKQMKLKDSDYLSFSLICYVNTELCTTFYDNFRNGAMFDGLDLLTQKCNIQFYL